MTDLIGHPYFAAYALLFIYVAGYLGFVLGTALLSSRDTREFNIGAACIFGLAWPFLLPLIGVYALALFTARKIND